MNNVKSLSHYIYLSLDDKFKDPITVKKMSSILCMEANRIVSLRYKCT